MGSRADYTKRSTTVDVGTFRSITFDLTGDDAVNMAEIRATYEGVTYAWIGSYWLDGPTRPGHNGMGPVSVTFNASQAYRKVTGAANRPFQFTAVTSDAAVSRWSGTNTVTKITIYGTRGFVGPISLAPRNFWTMGSTKTRTLRIPDIGNLIEFKVLNVGNDGWHVNSVGSRWKGVSHQWTNNAWLDGDGGSTANPHPHAEIFSINDQDAARPCGSVSIFIDHRRYANTGGNIWATLTGTTGSSRRTLISNGVLQREDYTMSIGCALNNSNLGTFQNVELSLDGNDGIVVSEIAATYRGRTYRWLNNRWMDGNSRPPMPRLTFNASQAIPELGATPLTQFGVSAHTRGRLDKCVGDCDRNNHCKSGLQCFQRGGSQAVPGCKAGGRGDRRGWDYCFDPADRNRITVTAVTSDTRSASTNSAQNIIFYGTRGYYGPVRFARSFARAERKAVTMNVPNIGNLLEVRIINTGNDAWHVQQLSVDYGTPSTQYLWTQNADATRMYRVGDSDHRHGCGTVEIYISHERWADSNGILYARLTGTRGSSPETVISRGVDKRNTYSVAVGCRVNQTDLGTLRSLRVRSNSNNAAYLSEVSATYKGTTYRWYSSASRLVTLDNNGNGRTGFASGPNRYRQRTATLPVTAAKRARSGRGNTFQVKVVTSDRSWSNTNSAQKIIVYGSTGFVGPLTLAGARVFLRHTTKTRTLSLPNIGSFMKMKVLNTGGDGWHITQIAATYNRTSTQWTYNGWLDGDHATVATRSRLWSVTDSNARTPCGSASIYISHRRNGQTGNNLYATLTGTSRSSSKTLITDGVQRRGKYTIDVGCPRGRTALGSLRSVKFETNGNDGVNVGEFSARYAGSTYRWVKGGQVTRGGVWLDRNSRPRRPNIVLTAASAYRQLSGATNTTMTIRAVTSDRSHAQSGSRHMVLFFGTRGYVGPIQLTRRHSRNTTRNMVLQIADIGDFIEMRVENTGNDGWHLNHISADYKSRTYRWAYNRWLDGNGGYSSPHTDVFTSARTCTSSTGNCAGITCGRFKTTTPCRPDQIIFTQAQCQAAAARMRFTWRSSAGPEWASGCLFHRGGVYFSPHVDGTTQNPTDGYICDSQTKRQSPSVSTRTCPANGLIRSTAACRRASTAAGLGGSVTSAGTSWASGCLFHNGGVYYSPHATGSTQNPTDAYICTQCAA
jgi:hypothetical protein